MMSVSPSYRSVEFEPDVRELGEMLSDMLVEDRFHQVRVDAQLRCDQRRDTRRPLHPSIAFAAAQHEHGGGCLRPVDQFTLELAKTEPPLLRLDDFVRRARRDV